jgi:hypothetical protein
LIEFLFLDEEDLTDEVEDTLVMTDAVEDASFRL